MTNRRFKPDPATAQAARRELIEKLERGFQQVQNSDEFRSYLDTVSRFHKYSLSNTMLICCRGQTPRTWPDFTHGSLSADTFARARRASASSRRCRTERPSRQSMRDGTAE